MRWLREPWPWMVSDANASVWALNGLMAKAGSRRPTQLTVLVTALDDGANPSRCAVAWPLETYCWDRMCVKETTSQAAAPPKPRLRDRQSCPLR